MTTAYLVHNARIIAPGQILAPGWMLIQDGIIQAMGRGDAPQFEFAAPVNANGHTLMPGFIDVHVHGAVGHDTMDASPDGLRAMARFYASHGVTGFLATTWTETREKITRALEAIAATVGRIDGGAMLIGAHLEGPFINPKRPGAQNPAHVRRADPAEAMPYLEMGIVRQMSLASEFPENHWLIRECARRGINVSAAHTDATYADMQYAISMGLTQTTHTFNAMTPLGHRELGVVGAALMLPELRCELIADNIHVHPGAMGLLYRARGAENIVLITDAVRAAGMPEGEFDMDGRTASLRDGAVRLSDGTLAGSALTFDVGLRNFAAAVGQPFESIWMAASLNAARAIGIAHRTGSIEVGKDADLVLLDDSATVQWTMVRGEIVYQR